MISSWSETCQLLVNNAVCTPRHREETVEGVEMQWATKSSNLGFGGHESAAQGAETPLFLATDPSLEGLTGRYFEHKRDTVCPYMGDGSKVLELLELCEIYLDQA